MRLPLKSVSIVFRRPSLVLLFLIATSYNDASASLIYHNQFALYIPKGDVEADLLASKHGFINLGPIGDGEGSLENYYLFEHHGISKRSTVQSVDHTAMLLNEPEVKWFEQMVEKRRWVQLALGTCS